MVGSGHHSSPIQQYLDYFIIISMSRQDQGCDVWREGGRVSVHGLPALRNVKLNHLITKNSSLPAC